MIFLKGGTYPEPPRRVGAWFRAFKRMLEWRSHPHWLARRFDDAMRPQKISFGEMRDMGVRGVLVYRADYHCSHSEAMNADRWPVGYRAALRLRPLRQARGRGPTGPSIGIDQPSRR